MQTSVQCSERIYCFVYRIESDKIHISLSFFAMSYSKIFTVYKRKKERNLLSNSNNISDINGQSQFEKINNKKLFKVINTTKKIEQFIHNL